MHHYLHQIICRIQNISTLNIAFNKEVNGQLAIYNQTGQLVKQVTLFGQDKLQLPVSTLPTGMYIYKVYNNANIALYQGKFLKQ